MRDVVRGATIADAAGAGDVRDVVRLHTVDRRGRGLVVERREAPWLALTVDAREPRVVERTEHPEPPDLALARRVGALFLTRDPDPASAAVRVEEGDKSATL